MLLVGGSTRIVSLQQKIIDFFDGRDLLIRDDSIDVDCAVAQGATIMAEVLSGRLRSNITMLDVTPLSLGTDMNLPLQQNWLEYFFCTPEYECVSDVVIPRNSNIPIK